MGNKISLFRRSDSENEIDVAGALPPIHVSDTPFKTWSGDLDWWQTGIVYQIYPRSFQDSNNDGIGDLKGIISRLDYLQYIGMQIIWLSPIYRSPMVDFGYDVSDHTDVDPIFGTLEDFDELIKALHDKGMKLIMDYIPNHTSNKHRWFEASRKREEPYDEYYVWDDGTQLEDGTRVPPNNWQSVFGGPAWTWDDVREQFYLHQFDPAQPDLNWRNPGVKKDMQAVLEFWLDRGVDGFRVNAITCMYKAESFLRRPKDLPQSKPFYYGFLQHILETVQEWRNFFDEYEKANGRKHIVMVAEVYDPELTKSEYFFEAGADLPFNFNLVHLSGVPTGRAVVNHVEKWFNRMQGKWPNWVLGNHDQPRVASRVGELYVDALNMLLLLLPGTPTIYMGEEIGMKNIHLTYEQTVDPWGKNAGPEMYQMKSRDPCRSPMQWDDTQNSGFSGAETTWLPVHTDYETNSVRTNTAINSHLQIYRELGRLRKQNPFCRGSMKYVVITDNVFSFVRHYRGQHAYLVALNFGSKASKDNYSVTVNGHFYEKGTIMLKSGNVKLRFSTEVDLRDFKLKPGDGVVIELYK